MEESGRSLVLEQLEERIVLDGAVTDVQDVQDHAADGGQVDSLGWVYVDNGWWQEDNGSGWWWQESSGWFWNENTGWWTMTTDGYSWWSHGDHQFLAQDTSTGEWFWFDDISDQKWEPAFTWFADQLNSEWTWVYNDCSGTQYYTDDLNYFYQDHNDGAWYWYDTVNDGVWESAFSWYVDGSGVQVFNDWHSSEYIWGNDFHYIQQHTSSYANDAPVAVVPGAQTVDEDTDLTIPAIYVFDVDSWNDPIQVTLSVDHGTLTLADTTQISFVTGDGTQDTQMVFQGTWSQLNTALHDIVYRPDSNFDSSDSLSIVVDDLGNSGSGGNQTISESVAITVTPVNDAPTSDAIPNPSSAEDFGIFDYNVTSYFHDVDSILAYSLGSVTYYGGLTLADLSVSSSGIVSFSSASNANGSVDVQVIAGDGQHTTSQTFTFTVTPVNDAPTGADNTVTTNEDIPHTFIADEFGFSDVDAGDQLQAVQITSLPLAGHLQLNGVDVNLNDLISVTDINDGKLSFIPAPGANGTGYATFEFKVFDGTDFSTATHVVTVDVTPVDGFSTHSWNGDGNTMSLVVADVNGDGKLDIVEGNYGQASYVYLGDGTGNFSTCITFQIGGGTYNTSSLAVAYVNDDAYLDIIQGNYGQQSYVYLGNGSGDFSAVTGVSIGTGTYNTQSITVADLNGDTYLDIIQGNYGQQSYAYLGTGTGDFSAVTGVAIGNGTYNTSSMIVADVNNDTFLDILEGNDGQPNYVYLGTGSGDFSGVTGTAIGSGIYNTNSLALADVNGDTYLDIIQGNYGQQNYVYLGTGTGDFSAVTGAAIGSGANDTWSIAVGDLNGDGFLDIVEGNGGQINYYYLGNGSGDFSGTTGIPLSSATINTHSVLVADLNGDSYLDVVEGNYDYENYTYVGY